MTKEIIGIFSSFRGKLTHDKHIAYADIQIDNILTLFIYFASS
jgi:hypothetical protein